MELDVCLLRGSYGTFMGLFKEIHADKEGGELFESGSKGIRCRCQSGRAGSFRKYQGKNGYRFFQEKNAA